MGILEDCRYLRAVPYLMPGAWRRVFSRSYFEVANEMLDAMEDQVERARDPESGKPLAQTVYSRQQLDDLLSQDGDRPIGVIHNVEGAHALEGSLENLQRIFDRAASAAAPAGGGPWPSLPSTGSE